MSDRKIIISAHVLTSKEDWNILARLYVFARHDDSCSCFSREMCKSVQLKELLFLLFVIANRGLSKLRSIECGEMK